MEITLQLCFTTTISTEKCCIHRFLFRLDLKKSLTKNNDRIQKNFKHRAVQKFNGFLISQYSWAVSIRRECIVNWETVHLWIALTQTLVSLGRFLDEDILLLVLQISIIRSQPQHRRVVTHRVVRTLQWSLIFSTYFRLSCFYASTRPLVQDRMKMMILFFFPNNNTSRSFFSSLCISFEFIHNGLWFYSTSNAWIISSIPSLPSFEKRSGGLLTTTCICRPAIDQDWPV